MWTVWTVDSCPHSNSSQKRKLHQGVWDLLFLHYLRTQKTKLITNKKKTIYEEISLLTRYRSIGGM